MASSDVPGWVFSDAGFAIIIGGVLVVLSCISGVVGCRVGSGPLTVTAVFTFMIGAMMVALGVVMTGVPLW